MQTTSEVIDLNGLKRAIEEEMKSLKTLTDEIDKALRATRVAEKIENARRQQNDPKWLRELSAQYTQEVCARTLEVAQSFQPLEG